MTDPVQDCLSTDELREYALGRLSDVAKAALTRVSPEELKRLRAEQAKQ